MRNNLSLRSKIFISIFLFVTSFSGIALATPAEEAELEQLDKIEQELELQREWSKYRWGKASSECYQKYWVNSCLRDARADYRKEIDPIREQEVACMKCNASYVKALRIKMILSAQLSVLHQKKLLNDRLISASTSKSKKMQGPEQPI